MTHSIGTYLYIMLLCADILEIAKRFNDLSLVAD